MAHCLMDTRYLLNTAIRCQPHQKGAAPPERPQQVEASICCSNVCQMLNLAVPEYFRVAGLNNASCAGDNASPPRSDPNTCLKSNRRTVNARSALLGCPNETDCERCQAKWPIY
jgi:hypothetical protein